MSAPVTYIYEFGPFRLNASNHLLYRDGTPVSVTPKAFDVLLVLVQNKGRVLEKEELIRKVWPNTAVEENNLTVAISGLRKALGESRMDHRYIVTIPGSGYRFVADVREITEPLTAAKRISIPRLLIVPLATAASFAGLYFIWHVPTARDDQRQQPSSHYQLSFTGSAILPALSPDGRFAAYVVENPGGIQKVLVQDAAGGEPIEVMTTQGATCLRWSPDGSELLLVAGSTISLIPRLGGSPQQFRGTQFAAWSPDAVHIAHSYPASKKIFVLDRNTGQNRPLKLEGSFQWLVDLDWSPTTNILLFLTSEGSRYTLWTITLDGGQKKVFEIDDYIYSPRWSRDGQTIYYFRDNKETKDLWQVRAPADAASKVTVSSLITTGLQAGRRFSISSDARRLLYTRELEYSNLWVGEYEPHLKLTPITTGTRSIYSPTISPDGNWIAFAMGRSISEIYKIPIEGGKAQQLTFLHSYSDSPAWSPDGSRIAFGSNQGGKARTWVVSSEGGDARPFSRSVLGEGFNVAWAPGRKILYQRPGNRNYHVLDLATEQETPLITGDAVGWIWSPIPSPDGKRTAVLWNRNAGGIWILSSDGSPPFSVQDRSVFAGTYDRYRPAGWSADGKWIYLFGAGNGRTRILKTAATGGKPAVVAELSLTGIPVLRISPNGRRFVFPLSEKKTDIWMLEDFEHYH